MRYLDANVFLYYILDPEAGRNRMASKNLLMRVAEGSMRGPQAFSPGMRSSGQLRRR
jgi:hypothetical protein